ncbi:MAG: nucleotidyltransferase family protein [Anaerobutyricum sp.]
MKVAGIIAEYNPSHKGHQYHIDRNKSIRGRLRYCSNERRLCTKRRTSNCR